MRKSILLFFLISFCHRLSAQKTIVLEKIRCYDINQPLNYYLRNPKTAATITSQLNQSLLKHLKMPLSDTSQLPLELIDFKYVPPDIRPDYKNRDTSILHLYIDLFESDPYYYFRRNKDKEFDSATIKKTKTVFILRALLLDASQKLYKAETLDLLIGEAETPAIGNKVNNGIQLVDLAVTEKTFTEFFKTAMDLLLNTTNPLSSVQLNLQPAYMYDNYLLPKTTGRPRIFTTENKDITGYHYNAENELIRFGKAEYEEIRIRGKNAQKYPDAIMKSINETEHMRTSDFVFLNQHCRDVLRDKDYYIKMITQVDPAQIPEQQELLFTNFLEGDIQYLFRNTDTLARFSVLKKVTERTNLVSRKLIGNGIDTGTVYTSPYNGISNSSDWRVVYNYVLNGTLQGLPFRIKCSGAESNLKEFFVKDKLVCIADGKFYPKKFVVFDASLSGEFLNQLFAIGFNRFLE